VRPFPSPGEPGEGQGDGPVEHGELEELTHNSEAVRNLRGLLRIHRRRIGEQRQERVHILVGHERS
jgi:hypothetical protein